MTGHLGNDAALATASGVSPPKAVEDMSDDFPLIELRQYTLLPGRRDRLIEIFEREFVESQEALGMKIIGTFTDLDDPDRFVWIRGFKDMNSRLFGLSEFYDGPVWKAHRDAANATMVDSDNVLLLEAPSACATFDLPGSRAAMGEEAPSGLITASIYHLKALQSEAAFLFESEVAPQLARDGAPPLAWFVTTAAPNNFPRLPVRKNEHVLTWFGAFADDADRRAHDEAFKSAASALAPLIEEEPELLRLKPTSRSLLRSKAVAR